METATAGMIFFCLFKDAQKVSKKKVDIISHPNANFFISFAVILRDYVSDAIQSTDSVFDHFTLVHQKALVWIDTDAKFLMWGYKENRIVMLKKCNIFYRST